jgi:hypothetical protein
VDGVLEAAARRSQLTAAREKRTADFGDRRFFRKAKIKAGSVEREITPQRR